MSFYEELIKRAEIAAENDSGNNAEESAASNMKGSNDTNQNSAGTQLAQEIKSLVSEIDATISSLTTTGQAAPAQQEPVQGAASAVAQQGKTIQITLPTDAGVKVAEMEDNKLADAAALMNALSALV